MKKFNIGDKVVPLSKSLWGTLEESSVWSRAKEKNQDFIYVTGYEADEDYLICNENMLTHPTGDFFKEHDLIPYTEGAENINKAQALVSKFESLVSEANLVIKELKEFQSKIQYQNETSEVKVPNPRQQIINEAKEFVNKYQAVKKGDKPHEIGNVTAQQHWYDTDFVKKGNKVTALVYHLDYGKKRSSNKPNRIGRAICLEGDTFNQHIGEAIALGRVLGINVDKFINAVQPTEFAVGQVVHAHLSYDYNRTEVITSIKGSQAFVDKGGFHWLDRVKQNNFKILDDTNATYEVK